MIRTALLAVILVAPASALAQVGAATPPSTPGTSLGSSAPVLPKPPATSTPVARCERLTGEARDTCLRQAEAPAPASAGAPGTGMAGGRSSGGGAGTTGPGTGTAPGMGTR